MIAFWKYDIFPFLLGGEVIGREPDGIVRIGGGYGGGRFKPTFELPDVEGRQLLEVLDELDMDYRMHRRALDATFSRRAKAAIKRFKGKGQ